MTHLDALDLIPGHPSIRRLRELCESEDIEQREAYRAHVIRMAKGESPAPPPRPAPPPSYDTSWLPGPCGGCP